MNNHSNFLNIVKGSEAVRGRWAGIVEQICTESHENHGVSLTAEDVLNLRSARTAALGAPLDSDELQRELMALPALSDTALRDKIASGDEEARASALASLNRSNDVPAYRQGGSAADRISRARALGIAEGPPAKATATNDKLQLLQDISDPASRISAARKWGLI